MKRPRSWFAISVLGLMLAVLVVAGLRVWGAQRASIQRRALAEIEEVNGRVEYPESDWAPGWLRGGFGDVSFRDVTRVYLLHPNPTEKQPAETVLDAISGLDRLEELQVRMLSINDAGLAHIAHLPRLKSLNLELDGTT